MLTLTLVALLAGCHGSSEDRGDLAEVEIDGQNYVLVPSSMNDTRIEKAGLSTTGSEDVSHLLVTPAGLPDFNFDEERDYRPDDATEWILDIEFEGSPVLQLSPLDEVLSYEWMATVGNPHIYGWSPEISRWTYLRSADGPTTFTNLAFAWKLIDSLDEEYRVTAKQLDEFSDAVTKQVAVLGTPSIRENMTTTEAAQRSTRIRQAVTEFDKDVTVIVKASQSQFSGEDIWDVMQCLSLRWGDGDLFHWQNPSDLGDDFFFSVWTTTEPGYFFPEHIAAGRVSTADLVFGFSIPRSAEPMVVLESMLNAAEYTSKRLGGEICNEHGEALNVSDLRQHVKDTVTGLKEAGFKPGVSSTLYVF